MCDIIIIEEKDVEINTIQELMDCGINDLVLDKHYAKTPHTLNPIFCLCELDISATLKRNGYSFKRDYGIGYLAQKNA